MAKEVAAEYSSSLADLKVNSKPLINMLTILAEENGGHAGVIVDTVEAHLEKVQPDVKLPVLYLVDSIIKNVGGEYTLKFSQIIVNMFTKTFKVVDEKTRSQMFKLRETWHDVFPATKLYQLDVKVNLIDPAWPIQAQPQPHFNPNFLKKPAAAAPCTTTAVVPPMPTDDEEKMRRALARKEQELLMLQRKKIEMELEQTRRQLDLAEKNSLKVPGSQVPATALDPAAEHLPVPIVHPPVATASTVAAKVQAPAVPVKQRLGPPITKTAPPGGTGRIAPVSEAMLATVRRDPRLTRLQASIPPQSPIAPNVFDIKPLERSTKITKRKNVITIENISNSNDNPSRDLRSRRDPRINRQTRNREEDKPKRSDAREKAKTKISDKSMKKSDESSSRKVNRKYVDSNNQKSEDKKDGEKISDNVDKVNDNSFNIQTELRNTNKPVEEVIPRFMVADSKMINKLPPISKLNKQDDTKVVNLKTDDSLPSPNKRKKESLPRNVKKPSKKIENSSKDSSDSSSPDKKIKKSAHKYKNKEQNIDMQDKELITFKELKNYHKERYMRRNKEKSESPENIIPEEPEVGNINHKIDPGSDIETTNVLNVVENKDVDLRILTPMASEVPKAAPVGFKRQSTETIETKNVKKHKVDKFDILFGNEDVDLRQLPQVEDSIPPSQIVPETNNDLEKSGGEWSPKNTALNQKDWSDVKENSTSPEEKSLKVPSQLDLVRAKLAEATKGKDRLGRQCLFNSSPTGEKERRLTISSEDTDLRTNKTITKENSQNDKETIKIIISQAEEQFKEGNINKEQYNTLMIQVMQLNERLKLKEAKQRESLEESKRKLHVAHISDEENDSPKKDNTFGDIDERIVPVAYIPRDPLAQMNNSNEPLQDLCTGQDSDLRVPNNAHNDIAQPMIGPNTNIPVPAPPIAPPMFMPPIFPPMWGNQMPRPEDFPGGGPGVPIPPFFRDKFDKRANRNFDLPMPMPPLPLPSLGMFQGESPCEPYIRSDSPPPLGAPGVMIPPTDLRLLDYIDQDPMKTIEIDGVPREIRFYGETAVIMLEWDDPREIRFLPGSRRITFDNKDSIVLRFNEEYTTAEVDDQVFKIRFGAPTRELFVNNRWYECYFGGPPCGIVIEGIPRLIHLEGPLPKVDICNEKRTDLVAGKINLIMDAQHMCPVFLDAKPQKIKINNIFLTLRFVDSLKTVLINEVPFKVEFGGLPRPIFIGQTKHFIRFSVLPRYVKPGQIKIANMEGRPPLEPSIPEPQIVESCESVMDVDHSDEAPSTDRVQSPEAENSNGGLDILASVMPISMAPASQFSGYSLASTNEDNKIPGLDTPVAEKPSVAPGLPFLGNINVNDLFAKLVATGIVLPTTNAAVTKTADVVAFQNHRVDLVPKLLKEDKNLIKVVDLLKSETLRVKQPGIVAKLYGGMQCSGCGTRFPPEHTVRYSQHLDWHFRQNRRERDSARRAHSRHWHYDLSDWVQYEEIEDLEEREKSWFETGGAEGDGDAPVEVSEGEAPSVPAGAPQDQFCGLCGDKFDQFYNEDKEEWHLRKAVRHEDNNYHPLCYEDLKVSQTKKEEAMDEEPSVADEPSIIIIEKDQVPIEIGDNDDDEVNSQSDTGSVVEVLEDESQLDENHDTLVEIDEGDEDDVVLKTEPVVEVVVDDDADTDDETQAERNERDKQAFDFSKVKVKLEPVDPDDEPVITAEEEPVSATVDTTSTTVLSSIDGNVQLESRTAMSTGFPLSSIRINISTLPTAITRAPILNDLTHGDIADNEPPPPGEEPELEYQLKPAFEDIRLSRQPPIQKGTELSGLCSIM